MTIPTAQLGWMAGVIDLKGAFVRKRNKQRATPQIVLMVESRHYDVIRELARLTGTSPAIQELRVKEEWARRSCTEHCPDKHVHVQEVTMPSIARWQVTGVAVAVVLYNLQSFLRTSKPYTETMIECLQNIPPSGQGRSAVDRAIRRLAELGWDIPDMVYPPEPESNKEHVHAIAVEAWLER